MKFRLRELAAMQLLVLVAGCVEPDTENVGSNIAELSWPPATDVTWTSAVGVSVSGSRLTKTAMQTSWNAGAASNELLTTDGYVEFSTEENTTSKMVGLSVGNGNQNYTDIDFAIWLKATGVVAIVEGGTVICKACGDYAPGDTFRVQALNSSLPGTFERGITYWHNGFMLYSATDVPLTYPLLVDTSLATPGATISDVSLTTIEFWANVVNATVWGGDDLQSDRDGWVAGATSEGSISENGYYEFSVPGHEHMVCGLSHGNTDQSYQDIDYGIFLRQNGNIQIYEGGIDRGQFGGYSNDFRFRVQVENGVVTYWRTTNAGDTTLLYTSTVAPTLPLLADVSMRYRFVTVLDPVLVETP